MGPGSKSNPDIAGVAVSSECSRLGSIIRPSNETSPAGVGKAPSFVPNCDYPGDTRVNAQTTIWYCTLFPFGPDRDMLTTVIGPSIAPTSSLRTTSTQMAPSHPSWTSPTRPRPDTPMCFFCRGTWVQGRQRCLSWVEFILSIVQG